MITVSRQRTLLPAHLLTLPTNRHCMPASKPLSRLNFMDVLDSRLQEETMTQRFGTICCMFVIGMALAASTIAAAQGAAPAQTAPARGGRGGGAPTPPCGP